MSRPNNHTYYYTRRLIALLLAAVLGLSGCTLFDRQTTVEEEPETPDETPGISLSTDRTESLFTLGWSPELSLHPFVSSSTTNWIFLPLIYESLFQLNPSMEAEPLLCQSASASEDGRTWTLTLRQDAEFSNGVTMTAADVVYSLELAQQSERYGARLACLETIAQSGQYEVTLGLTQPMGSLPQLLDTPIIRAGSAEAPIGTGPYVLIQQEDEAYLEHVAGWRGGEAPIGRIYLYQVSNTDSVRDAFEFDRIDLVVSDLNAGGSVNFHSDYELWSQDTPVLQFLSFNADSDLFASASVRAAVTHAIDRQGLITDIFRGYGVAATLPAHPRSSCYQLSLAEDFDYQAGALAEAAVTAGVTGRRGTLLVCSDNAANVRAAEAIAQALRDEGLEIEVTPAAGEAFDSLLALGGYDLAYCEVRLTADYDLSAFFGGSLSAYALQHEDAPALCAAALENSGNFYDLHKLIMEEGLLCPLLFKTRAVMASRGAVSGLNPAPGNVFYGIEQLSILSSSTQEEE